MNANQGSNCLGIDYTMFAKNYYKYNGILILNATTITKTCYIKLSFKRFKTKLINSKKKEKKKKSF